MEPQRMEVPPTPAGPTDEALEVATITLDAGQGDGHSTRPPQWVVLVINNFCNLHCRMCDVGIGEVSSAFYAHLVGDDPRNMSGALLDTILEQAAVFTPRPRVGLAYTEPLLHKAIVPFCRRIKDAGFYCAITTNGFLLPRLADDLVDIGVDEIVISVDGPAAVHDRIRGTDGSFRQLYEGAERLNAAKDRQGKAVPQLQFSYTLTDENYTHMTAFLREVTPLRPAAYIFSHLNFIDETMAAAHNAQHEGAWAMNRSNLGTIDLETIDLDAMWHALEELKEYAAARPDMAPVTIVPDLGHRAGLDVYYRQPLEFVGGRGCTDPWRMVMVRTDGTVIPAHGRCYNIPIGNVESEPLVECWNNHQFLSFRKTLSDAGGSLPACARCCGVIGKPATPTD
jgi:MoaA/NifB/PqqE/SkfB family radical SAM enzyme